MVQDERMAQKTIHNHNYLFFQILDALRGGGETFWYSLEGGGKTNVIFGHFSAMWLKTW